MMADSATRLPPSCLAILPQKFSAATTTIFLSGAPDPAGAEAVEVAQPVAATSTALNSTALSGAALDGAALDGAAATLVWVLARPAIARRAVTLIRATGEQRMKLNIILIMVR